MPAKTGELSQRRARTRDRLVQAATDVVAAEGFYSASVVQIAARAGLSIGALYSNFAGKDDLLLAVFDGHVRWFQKRVTATLEDPDLAGVAASWLRLRDSDSDQFLVFIEFWAYAVRRPKVRVQFAKRMAEMRAEIATAVQGRAQGRGSASPLPADIVALLTLALARGLALEKLVDADVVPDEAVAQLLAGLLP